MEFVGMFCVSENHDSSLVDSWPNPSFHRTCANNYGTYGIRLFRSPISASLSRADVIVFEFPQDRSLHYAKRLIGLPGDKIEYRGKKLSVNGEPIALRQTSDYFNSKNLSYTPTFIESLAGVEYSILLEKDAPPSIAVPLAFPFRDKCSYDSEGVTCVVPDGNGWL